MTNISNRRDSIAQRSEFMRGIIDQVVCLDDDSILSKVALPLREHLSNPRFSRRLAMRYAREFVPEGLFSDNADPSEAAILRGGSETVTKIAIRAGVYVRWHEVIRLVRREDRENLDDDLGIPTREVALRGRQRALSFNVADNDLDDETNDVSMLAQRIRKEGALCWACWLAAREPVSARRLRVLTPARVSRFITGGIPGTKEERGFRRLAVDLEVDELIADTHNNAMKDGDS